MLLHVNNFEKLTNIARLISGGLDTAEPWQGRWAGGVLVECVGTPDNKKVESNRNRQPQTSIGSTGQTKY